jgi:hypothetical protein
LIKKELPASSDNESELRAIIQIFPTIFLILRMIRVSIKFALKNFFDAPSYFPKSGSFSNVSVGILCFC